VTKHGENYEYNLILVPDGKKVGLASIQKATDKKGDIVTKTLAEKVEEKKNKPKKEKKKEVKEEAKEEAKQEVKEEAKQEVKEEAKQEVKEEAKQEPTEQKVEAATTEVKQPAAELLADK
jgi:hypothetical protein